jgi:hypothetical protein
VLSNPSSFSFLSLALSPYHHQIEVLKSYIDLEFGIPMNESKLSIDGKFLLDPMSLLDYPEFNPESGEDIYVTVEGELRDENRK